MTRRSFVATMNRAARAAERSHRARLRAEAARTREIAREQKLMARAEREHYLGSRAADVEGDNAHLAEMRRELESLLITGIRHNLSIKFSSLHRHADEKSLDEQPALKPGVEPVKSDFLPPPLGFFARMFGPLVRKHEALTTEAIRQFEDAKRKFSEISAKRELALEALKAEVSSYNKGVEKFRQDVENGAPDALVRYAEMVLDASEYPDGFPQDFKIAYVAESKQLVVEYELPRLEDIISEFEEFRYVRSSDKVTAKKKSEKIRSGTYSTAIAQVTLRTLHELFSVAGLTRIESIVFNGLVNTIDPATGHAISPYLISVRTTRQKFQSLELGSVDPIACLRSLNAAVSRSPRDLVAVKPILEFNMVDPRFVSEQDILSSLDTRPNLMELTPSEFESLITNLFQSMGLETKLTQASRDGGVDCVAYDSRPILGGKVVVQAKRYRHTVGVSAVRDLFGTMHNEGASKGILVTTSGFGNAAFSFANGKPIELITGSNLLFLLKEHGGVEAKIEIPADWVDPVADAPEPVL